VSCAAGEFPGSLLFPWRFFCLFVLDVDFALAFVYFKVFFLWLFGPSSLGGFLAVFLNFPCAGIFCELGLGKSLDSFFTEKP